MKTDKVQEARNKGQEEQQEIREVFSTCNLYLQPDS